MSHRWRGEETNQLSLTHPLGHLHILYNILSFGHIADHILFISASYENPKV